MHAYDKNPLSYSTDERDFIGFLSEYTQLLCFSFIEQNKNKLFVWLSIKKTYVLNFF